MPALNRDSFRDALFPDNHQTTKRASNTTGRLRERRLSNLEIFALEYDVGSVACRHF
ncbi:protein of unknown function (plasmid) [Caballeronia sp. S22]